MSKHEEVMDFIHRRWSKDCNWNNGNCFWFALILSKRFPYSRIYYMPVKGNFITRIGGVFYDAHGVVPVDEKIQTLASLKKEDSLLVSRLFRDCFL